MISDWIKDLKVGDKVMEIEIHPSLPNGRYTWMGEVTIINSAFIEVKWSREYGQDWLNNLTAGLGNNHHTYAATWTKHYFHPDDKVNIEPFVESP